MLKSKQLTRYFGFTEDEVKKLCITYDMDFESIKAWYNGYLIDGLHMYNPNSVVQAMLDHDYVFLLGKIHPRLNQSTHLSP